MYWEVKWWYCEYGSCFEGTYKVRNEIETKRNENEIDWYEENGRKKIKDKMKWIKKRKKKDNSIF